MASDIPDITPPLTDAKIRRGITTIVEQVHPVPRGENCMPVAGMEADLVAFTAEAVRLAYADSGDELKRLRANVTDILLGAVENGPWVGIEEPDLRAQVGRYIADTAAEVGEWAGLDEVHTEARKQRGEGPLPTSLLGDARERLARHLYLSRFPTELRDNHARFWDLHHDDATYGLDFAYERADELLAVITRKDG
jgi:hypothetical protein